MPGDLHRFLCDDHVRLDGLLADATRSPPSTDLEAYDRFAAGLFRHIAMEEKVLLPEATRRRAGVPLEIEKQLRADHAALGALLVPSPTREIISNIRLVLASHNPLEEGPGGLYETCELLCGPETTAILDRLRQFPMMRAPRHLDGPRFLEQIDKLMRARDASRVQQPPSASSPTSGCAQ